MNSFFIVLLSYNHPELTARALESILTALPDSEWVSRVLLVHNGSLPESVYELKNKFPRVQHLVLEINKGFSGGANAGIDSAIAFGGEVVFFYTNDCQVQDFPFSEKIGKNFQFFLEHEKIFVPEIFMKKRRKVDSFGGGFSPRAGELMHIHPLCPLPKGFLFYVPGTAFAVHAKLWKKLGGFDERLGTYWEDVDLSMRVHALEKNTGLNENDLFEMVKEFRLEHLIGKTTHKNSAYTIYYFHRNRLIVSLRYSQWFEKPILFVVLVFDFFRITVRLLRSRRKKDALLLCRAFYDGLNFHCKNKISTPESR